MQFIKCTAELKDKPNKLMIEISPKRPLPRPVQMNNQAGNFKTSSDKLIKTIVESLNNSSLNFEKFYIYLGKNIRVSKNLFNSVCGFGARVTKQLKLHRMQFLDKRMFLKILIAFAHCTQIDMSTYQLYFNGAFALKNIKLDISMLQLIVISKYNKHIQGFIDSLDSPRHIGDSRYESNGADFIQTDSNEHLFIKFLFESNE